MNTEKNLEIEVKFYLPEKEIVRRRILSLDPTLKGRVFESNIRFDDGISSLLNKGSLLRLRKDERIRLTYKSRASVESSQSKIRRELEVELNDFDLMREIIHGLGYTREQVYEKYRETFILNTVEICIDTMPFGDFLEIEGPCEDDILDMAEIIGMDWKKRIRTNYLGIFDLIRKRRNLSFTDLTFENFKSVQVDMGDYLPMIEAGNQGKL